MYVYIYIYIITNIHIGDNVFWHAALLNSIYVFMKHSLDA